MAKLLVKDPKARILVPGEEPRPVLREVRCLSNGVFPKEDFVLLSKSTLLSSMWETSIASRKIVW
jgi:hypothetical protein